MGGYLCCAACLHAIHEGQERHLVDGRWYHPDHAPGPAESVEIEA